MKKIITLVLIALTTAILIYTKPLNNINIVKAEIEDLTNTTWIFNEEPSIIDIGGGFRTIFNINFTSNETGFTQLIFEVDTYMQYKNQNTTTNVYTDGAGWSNDYWKEITITGGTDATNTTLMNWLENNAEIQIPTITLTTPTLTINHNTLLWNNIQNASYYNIYLNGQLYAQATTNQWTTIENGEYQVQACTNEEGYSNSLLSNTIEQDNYNDIIGNGVNFYTLFGAIIDSEIYLIKALTDYTIWGINLYSLFKLFITTCLIIIIIKFALKQQG